MHEGIKEHDRDIQLARTQTSAVSEHTHETGHYPFWNEAKFIDLHLLMKTSSKQSKRRDLHLKVTTSRQTII